ncbi:MAG: hypothetical protein KatS3mg113_0173 [Planctomycetaceae bacterium]|nr:MAG: hypothetical protein KatS3mg113_0173 [Planctomycetaceae bacterium]
MKDPLDKLLRTLNEFLIHDSSRLRVPSSPAQHLAESQTAHGHVTMISRLSSPLPYLSGKYFT